MTNIEPDSPSQGADITPPVWGLKRAITPQFGARLVQQGHQLHYLGDRADVVGTFSDAELRHLDQQFPLWLQQLESMLMSGELNPRQQHCVTLHTNGLTCEADTLGSCGYVYIAIYPTPAATA
ncbi:type IV toxin-antitoxin system YeeU family antitoxin [Serratia sp. DD3]|uniref:type IV toxin-antitoxin system YeeU family antitoxin n=1 Tax=Serratia sp. DD3 TaxID=1410619 RepID=UPI0003C50B3C|nr:type IV toxin-antitoxin system YeeU family antitoxin [Serratia sp. DD3]KEY59857.1 putative antitoxin YfjZ [Serratia sp. DD3]KEY60207.1 putative antitoxin YfjZ [Serratia sp. DD3]